MKKRNYSRIKKSAKLIPILLGTFSASALFLAGCSSEQKKALGYNWTNVTSWSDFTNIFNRQPKDGDQSKAINGFLLYIGTSSCPYCRADRDVSEDDMDNFLTESDKNSTDWTQKYLDSYPQGNGTLNDLAKQYQTYSIFIDGFNIEDSNGFEGGIDTPTSPWYWLYNLKQNSLDWTFDKTNHKYSWSAITPPSTPPTDNEKRGWMTHKDGDNQTGSYVTMNDLYWSASSPDSSVKWPTTWNKTAPSDGKYYQHWPMLLFINRANPDEPFNVKAITTGYYKENQITALKTQQNIYLDKPISPYSSNLEKKTTINAVENSYNIEQNLNCIDKNKRP
ncbi:hypothetical protein ASO20_00805 [Mycoplasma sp. (ex Biomphalaria glabrata)]|uniref:hypothetical protein n=1 Tax=Mycoplasma sp. (ex Biomphalaria glabrata) TaxID=1749074 RepID=UPI00073ABF91|nr:hypothetical protein [Mycoplasma sp. (ex Biomphalaria glabrata)]ALV23216.1 hypothetical protein ASO20_00805 [Mycoplasma sp. (ex Biomphalaria glabrata)]